MEKRSDPTPSKGTEPEPEASTNWKTWANIIIHLMLLMIAAWVGASYSGPLWHIIVPGIIVFAVAELLMDRFLPARSRRDSTSLR